MYIIELTKSSSFVINTTRTLKQSRTLGWTGAIPILTPNLGSIMDFIKKNIGWFLLGILGITIWLGHTEPPDDYPSVFIHLMIP